MATWFERLGFNSPRSKNEAVQKLLERKRQRRLARKQARENPAAPPDTSFNSQSKPHRDRAGPVITWRPRPLLNQDQQLIVVWSPKSACTTVYVWFAHLSGFLDELRSTNDWPHVHRSAVYYRSGLYRRSLTGDVDRYRMVRVIRDPYSRAASIYRHALKSQFLEAEVLEHFKGRVSSETGYSFVQFLEVVGSQNLSSCNPHCRPQFHPLETSRRADVIINISNQDLFVALNETEDKLDLPRTKLLDIAWLKEMERKRSAPQIAISGEELDHAPFTRLAAMGKAPFPHYAQLLTPGARSIIEDVYRVDFEVYADVL